jgi:hypothetical protein
VVSSKAEVVSRGGKLEGVVPGASSKSEGELVGLDAKGGLRYI